MEKRRINTIKGVFKRECLRFLREPIQTIFSMVFYNFAFLTALYYMSPKNLKFIVPGIIVYTSFNIALSNVKMSLFIGKVEKVIYYQLASPITRVELYFIYLIATLIRSIIVNFLILILINMLFIRENFVNYLIFVPIFIGVNLFFINLSILVTLFYKNWNSVGVAESYIIAPLLYISGGFFSLKEIPSGLKKVIEFNPFFHMTNILRYSYSKIVESSLNRSILICIILLFISFTLVIYLFKKGIKLLK